MIQIIFLIILIYPNYVGLTGPESLHQCWWVDHKPNEYQVGVSEIDW
jgi:hypothetical protein